MLQVQKKVQVFVKILGIDPGKTTGLAMIEIKEKVPRPIFLDSSKDETLVDQERLFSEADVIVCEDWKTRPGIAMTGGFNQDRMPATRVIGAAQTLARLKGKQFVLQPASIKPVGYGWSNQKYQAGKKGLHTQDALAHAVYYAVNAGLCFPVKPKKF